jgi:uncharacterized protein (DUF433 family)
MLASGDDIADLLAEYPSLTRAAVLACLDYAASLAEEETSSVEQLEGTPVSA